MKTNHSHPSRRPRRHHRPRLSWAPAESFEPAQRSVRWATGDQIVARRHLVQRLAGLIQAVGARQPVPGADAAEIAASGTIQNTEPASRSVRPRASRANQMFPGVFLMLAYYLIRLCANMIPTEGGASSARRRRRGWHCSLDRARLQRRVNAPTTASMSSSTHSSSIPVALLLPPAAQAQFGFSWYLFSVMAVTIPGVCHGPVQRSRAAPVRLTLSASRAVRSQERNRPPRSGMIGTAHAGRRGRASPRIFRPRCVPRFPHPHRAATPHRPLADGAAGGSAVSPSSPGRYRRNRGVTCCSTDPRGDFV
jgi:hypothetical protein